MDTSLLRFRPQLQKALLFGVLTCCGFGLLMAQDGGDVGMLLKQNLFLTEQLGLLGPLAVSPYWGLCLASLASLLGYGGNEFLLTHPFLGNWVVFVLFLLFAILTSIPNITKFSKALGVAANYLEDNTSIVVVVLAMLLPGLHTAVAGGGPAEFGFLDSFSFYSLLMAAFSSLYMFIVTTVRLFFEVTAFITPVPFIDTVVEIAKKLTSLVMMGIYFVSPEVAMIISLVLLLVAFLLYRRASSTMNYFKQFYIAPLLSWCIRRKRGLLDESIARRIKGKDVDFAVPVWTVAKWGKIRKRRRAWLVEEGEGAIALYQLRFLRAPVSEPIYHDGFPEGIHIRRDFNFLTIADKHETLHLRVSREYFRHEDELARIGGFIDANPPASDDSGMGWWAKVKLYFSPKQVAADGEI